MSESPSSGLLDFSSFSEIYSIKFYSSAEAEIPKGRIKKYKRWVSNPRPSACKADVIATTPHLLNLAGAYVYIYPRSPVRLDLRGLKLGISIKMVVVHCTTKRS